jgi:hypothetical protein
MTQSLFFYMRLRQLNLCPNGLAPPLAATNAADTDADKEIKKRLLKKTGSSIGA